MAFSWRRSSFSSADIFVPHLIALLDNRTHFCIMVAVAAVVFTTCVVLLVEDPL